MYAYHIIASIMKDKKLELNGLPFQEGDQVDVVILKHTNNASAVNKYPLRGEPIQYEAPFEPVAEQDWEVIN